MESKLTELIPEINNIKDEDLRKKVINIWEEAVSLGGWKDPSQIPFNPAIGPSPSLIDHTRSVTRTALFFADEHERAFEKGIDRDLLAASAILHDVSKVLEYEPSSSGPVKSELGKKVPHGSFGGFLAWKVGLPLEFLHMILTHTPTVEMLPGRIEGVIMHYADLMDADYHYFGSAVPTVMERYK